MLQTLYIENFAIIENLSIDFEQGLNVFTGETGAGKSIIIGAINCVLGNRASKDFVRSGAEKAKIIASFSNIPKTVSDKLLQNDINFQDEIIIYREISSDGKSVAKINGIPITINFLKELTSELINIHGQHDTQILLKSEKHIEILDSFCDFGNTMDEYSKLYYNIVSNNKKIKQLSENEELKRHKIDLLSYQVNEIEKADLVINEDKDLEEKKAIANNSKKFLSSLTEAKIFLLGDDDNQGGLDLVSCAINSLFDVTKLDTEVEQIYNKMIEQKFELECLTTLIEQKLNAFDVNLDSIELINDRLDEINKLKRKYGFSIEVILDSLEQYKSELSELTFSEEKIKELQQENSVFKQKIYDIADKITEIRKKSAKILEKKISEELEFLQMPNVVVEINITTSKYTSNGNNIVEILISTNKGEPPKSIAKIASGGELSRIMLALKNVFAQKDDIQTLIFDEIDTGVSGKSAQKIGLKLKQVSEFKQVICITHLAQIASLAKTNYLIQKQTVKDKTFTVVNKLDFEQKVLEIARIIGTEDITQNAIETAKEMISIGNK